MEIISDQEIVSIVYTNYRGETAVRHVIPRKIWFGGTDWHHKKQWLLDAYDIDKKADRSFAMKDIGSWSPVKKIDRNPTE